MKLADFGLAIEVQGDQQAWFGEKAQTDVSHFFPPFFQDIFIFLQRLVGYSAFPSEENKNVCAYSSLCLANADDKNKLA